MQPLLERLMTDFPDAIRGVEADTVRNEVTARVAAARIVDIARWLHDTPEASFDHITDICAVDYPDDRNALKSCTNCSHCRIAGVSGSRPA